jgi:hypothetical protein
MLEAWISGGGVAFLILALLLLEALAIWAWRRARGRGPRLRDVAGTLVSGACMILALRAAATGQGAAAIGGLLSLSFLAHAYDMWRRGPWL